MTAKSRDEAFALLSEYTKTSGLIKHALSVEAAMRWYARHFNKSPDEIEAWGIAGLLHDFDYERFPELSQNGHPYKGGEILASQGYAEEIRHAIMAHALFTGTPRDTEMAKTLFAVDELTGLITAAVYVRPDRSIMNLEAKSVIKRMKDKAFARGCNRDEIKMGAEELGIELSQHIQNVIEAMKQAADVLELKGQ